MTFLQSSKSHTTAAMALLLDCSPCERQVRVRNRSNSLQQVVADPVSNAWPQVLVLRVLGDGHITQSLVSH